MPRNWLRPRLTVLPLEERTVPAVVANPDSYSASEDTPLSVTAESRAIASYNAMQQYLYRGSATSLYHERNPVQAGDNAYSYLWPFSQAYQATADMSLIGSYRADVPDRAVGLGHYDGTSGQAPDPRSLEQIQRRLGIE